MKFSPKQIFLLLLIFGLAGYIGQSFIASLVTATGLTGIVASILTFGGVGLLGIISAKALKVL